MKTLVVIPTRMASKRFPGKPMALIKGKPMIQRVWEQAISSKIGDVIVACSEKEVHTLITALGGKAELTNPNLPSGTDRIFVAIQNYPRINQCESIINLQGDMPLIDPKDIVKVNFPLEQGFDIGTLATNFKENNEIKNKNITKVRVEWIRKELIGKALDFHKNIDIIKQDNYYHHVGIYSFRYETLKKFVSMSSSENEKIRQLEQMRALDANMSIGVGYVKNVPISVDTSEDLQKAEELINKSITYE